MADNSAQGGTDVIATDELTTLNGGAVSGFKVQRVKPGYGVDAALRDVSLAFPLPVTTDSKRVVSYRGRASSFRMPGRAGTAGQKIFSIHNATGSSVLVDVEKISIDMTATVVKAVTVLPPMIRLYRVTVLPTNGTAATKVPVDTALSSAAAVTVLQDASADGTASASALTATLPAGAVITQSFAPRFITAAGYEMMDRFDYLAPENERITLRALEGIVLVLDYVLATQNPVTDMWLVTCDWVEYTAGA